MIDHLEIIRTGQTARGSPLVTPDELEISLEYLKSQGLYVQSMESYIIELEQEIPDFEFCLLGLDGSENPNDGYNSARAFELTLAKIRGARASPREVRFKVWLDDISALDGPEGGPGSKP